MTSPEAEFRILIIAADRDCKNPQPITAIKLLKDCGVTLLHAKSAYEMLAFGPAMIQLPSVVSVPDLRKQLADAGVKVLGARYRLKDLIAQCDPDAPTIADLLAMPGVEDIEIERTRTPFTEEQIQRVEDNVRRGVREQMEKAEIAALFDRIDAKTDRVLELLDEAKQSMDRIITTMDRINGRVSR